MVPPWFEYDEAEVTWAFQIDAVKSACPHLSAKLDRIGTIQRYMVKKRWEDENGWSGWFLRRNNERLTCTEIEKSLPELIKGDHPDFEKIYFFDGVQSRYPSDYFIMRTNADKAWVFKADEADELCWTLALP